MIRVDRPEMPPGCCIVSRRHEDADGFVDTGITESVIDPRVYVSAGAVQGLAATLDFPLPSRVEQLDTLHALQAARERIAELESELAEADRTAQAVHTLTRAGFQARSAPPRKPSKTKPKAAVAAEE